MAGWGGHFHRRIAALVAQSTANNGLTFAAIHAAMCGDSIIGHLSPHGACRVVSLIQTDCEPMGPSGAGALSLTPAGTVAYFGFFYL